jgi:seryl-tRNA synthetase
MHDIKEIRKDPGAFDAAMARRGIGAVSGELLGIDARSRAGETEIGEIRARRNAIAREVGAARRSGADTSALQAEATALGERIAPIEAIGDLLRKSQRERLAALPNRLDGAVPDGRDETCNVVVRTVGGQAASAFRPRQHFEIGADLGLMDFEGAAKVAGSRFVVLRGALARLERALGQFMLDLHVDRHGYVEAFVPALVNDAAVYGTGQLPKFAEDLFRTTDGRWLVPTAEVPLTNLVAGEILRAAELPIRLAALTECFRSEAGASGRDVRGMMRQHQFRKVEMVSVVRPEDGEAEHERMTRCAEAVLEALGLPYRRVLLCAGDTGFGAAKTYDLEVWLPGQGAWREISSCSWMRDFQARRMNARYRPAEGTPPDFVHTLNGSGLAVGRTLIAVMENWQTEDAVTVPPVLRDRMGGMETIRKA